MKQNVLLSCGIASSLLYIAMNAFVPLLFAGYSTTTQTVSELSAIGAPTRSLWVWLAMLYILLFAAFGLGVWQSAADNKALRTTGKLILIYVLINFYWPPMHLRGFERTMTDTLHIVWAMITLFLMMSIMVLGAVALGRLFRIYTFMTFVIFITFGILIGTEAPGIPQNTPTPHIGIWERINIGTFMLWVIVFAVTLLKREKVFKPGPSGSIEKIVTTARSSLNG